MNSIAQITYRNVEHSDVVTQYINDKFTKLKRQDANIMRCHVVISQPHKSHRSGNVYHVKIDVTIPGKEIIGRSKAGKRDDDLYTNIASAFAAVQVQLKYRKFRKPMIIDEHKFSNWFAFSPEIRRIVAFAK